MASKKALQKTHEEQVTYLTDRLAQVEKESSEKDLMLSLYREIVNGLSPQLEKIEKLIARKLEATPTRTKRPPSRG